MEHKEWNGQLSSPDPLPITWLGFSFGGWESVLAVHEPWQHMSSPSPCYPGGPSLPALVFFLKQPVLLCLAELTDMLMSEVGGGDAETV